MGNNLTQLKTLIGRLPALGCYQLIYPVPQAELNGEGLFLIKQIYKSVKETTYSNT